MENYLEGWKALQDVTIPPIKTNGFRENVIIRKSVLPISYAIQENNGEADNPTIFLGETYDADDDKTVLVEMPVIRAYIRRISTNEEAEITGNPFVIGKSSSCDFIVGNNSTVSRRHAEIQWTEEGYFLRDLNSTNHTMVDEKQIEQKVQLKDGMMFRLSDEQFRFRMEIK